MKYEDALKMWGYNKLKAAHRKGMKISGPGDIYVEFAFDPGSHGSQSSWNDYYSWDESASVNLFIRDIKTGKNTTVEFDLTTFMRELIAAGDGELI